MSTEMRVGDCPGCGKILTFELETLPGGLEITAGHEDPSCDWYKKFPDSTSVAMAVGLVDEEVKSVREEMTRVDTGESFAVEGRLDFTCPFCSGKVVVSHKPQAVMHSRPPCQKYVDEDPLVFFRNARVAKYGPMPDDDEWPVRPAGEVDRNNN